MKRESIGELEELVLLAVGSLYEKAYAISILQEINSHSDRHLDVTAIHAVLRRLEGKGFVTSTMGGAVAERGGRRKRFFSLTVAGRKIIDETMVVRMEMYKKLLSAQG